MTNQHIILLLLVALAYVALRWVWPWVTALRFQKADDDNSAPEMYEFESSIGPQNRAADAGRFEGQ